MSTPGELRTKRPRIVPDGIVAHKRDLAQRGGFTAVGIAAVVSLFGAAVLALTSSAFFEKPIFSSLQDRFSVLRQELLPTIC